MSNIKIEIVYPGDGWILDRLAKTLINQIKNAFGSERLSNSNIGSDIVYFMHYGLYQAIPNKIVGCFFPHKEPPDDIFDAACISANFCVAPCNNSLISIRQLNKNSHLIYHGIDLERYKPKLKIGFVGREYPSGRKGTNILPKFNELEFVDLYITNGKYSDEEMPNFIRAMDAILISSSVEGGPLCFQEALACGVKVISTPVGMVNDFKHLPGVDIFEYNDWNSLRLILEKEYNQKLLLREGIKQYDLKYFAEKHEILFFDQYNLFNYNA